MTIVGAFLVATLVLLIGCGGGGGGGGGTTGLTGSTATSTATTSTTATGTTATGTTATGSTATGSTATTSTGSTSGSLDTNKVFFTDTIDGGTTYTLHEVNPDGTNLASLGSLNANFQGLALNPAVKGQKVFGYTASVASPNFGIYKNTAVSITGATAIVQPIYSAVSQIQVSIDGLWVYYVAAIGNGNYELYKVSSSGGIPIVLDSGDIYTFNVDTVTGTQVVYDKNFTYTNGNSETAVFLRLTSASGTPVSITNDPSHNYETPQFSKDATEIVLASDKDATNFDIYSLSATASSTNGSGLNRISTDGIGKSYGVAFGNNLSTVGYVGIDPSGGSGTGLYVATKGATSTTTKLIVPDSSIVPGIYWTSSNGRSICGVSGSLGNWRHRKRP